MAMDERYYNPRRKNHIRKRLYGRAKPAKMWRVAELWDQHKEMARLRALGMKPKDIAKQMGYSQQAVSQIINSPIVKDQIDILQFGRDVDTVKLIDRIKNFMPTCLDLLEDVIRGKHEDASLALRVRTAQDYADRGGLGAVKKHQVMSANLTREDLEEIKNRARNSGLLAEGST